MYEIILLIFRVLLVILLCVRLKLISFIAHIALQNSKEVKRTFKEKIKQSNITAGRF
jgi:hypothetical protein